MYLEQIRPPRAVEQRKDNHMGIKIGINGFGRIGRVVLRILADDPERFEVCGINLRKADVDYMVYLLKYDSVFRNFPGIVEHAGGDLIVNGRKIKVYSESDAAMINWADCGAEYIIESTGANNTTDKASRHFKGGAKKVILTAPAKDDATPTFVFGVNSDEYRSDMRVISNASCTTNCLAPLAYVIHKEFGIEQSLMSTIHASTAKQKAVDSRGGSDWRTGRSVMGNIIPSTTGAAKAIGEVMPNLKGSLNGASFRVPTPTGSLTDFVAVLKKDVTVEEVNAAMKEAAEGPLKGILAYSEEALVLQDIVSDPHSCIFDSGFTYVVGGNLVKVCGWYDNEWGYSNRAAQAMKKLGDSLGCGCSCGK